MWHYVGAWDPNLCQYTMRSVLKWEDFLCFFASIQWEVFLSERTSSVSLPVYTEECSYVRGLLLFLCQYTMRSVLKWEDFLCFFASIQWEVFLSERTSSVSLPVYTEECSYVRGLLLFLCQYTMRSVLKWEDFFCLRYITKCSISSSGDVVGLVIWHSVLQSRYRRRASGFTPGVSIVCATNQENTSNYRCNFI